MQMNRQNKKVTVITIISLLLGIVVSIILIFKYFDECYTKCNPEYLYESSYDWMDLDLAQKLVSDGDIIKIYKERTRGRYYDGVSLIAVYNNLSNNDRIITSFKVKAYDIVEDLSPYPVYSLQQSYDVIECQIGNIGWGEAGPFKITYDELVPDPEYDNQTEIEISISQNAPYIWYAGTLSPGERCYVALLSQSDFIIYPEDIHGIIYYRISFTVEDLRTNQKHNIYETLEISDKGISVLTNGLGEGEKNYVVCIDTSSSKWEETYKTYQILPAKKSVRIPMYFFPAKSCTMSLQIEFETMDGRKIKATPLVDAYFFVPYYEGTQESFIDGLLIDEYDNFDDAVIYFPFEDSTDTMPLEYNKKSFSCKGT